MNHTDLAAHRLRLARKHQAAAANDAARARHYLIEVPWPEAAVFYQERSAHEYRLARRLYQRAQGSSS